MNYQEIMFSSFNDELEKIAAGAGWAIPALGKGFKAVKGMVGSAVSKLTPKASIQSQTMAAAKRLRGPAAKIPMIAQEAGLPATKILPKSLANMGTAAGGSFVPMPSPRSVAIASGRAGPSPVLKKRTWAMTPQQLNAIPVGTSRQAVFSSPETYGAKVKFSSLLSRLSIKNVLEGAKKGKKTSNWIMPSSALKKVPTDTATKSIRLKPLEFGAKMAALLAKTQDGRLAHLAVR